MRYPSFLEASKYHAELPPKISEIYRNGSTTYSSFRTMSLSREFSVQLFNSERCGILRDAPLFWYYEKNGSLVFQNYEAGGVERVENFGSEVVFVKSFIAHPGVFSRKIVCCILVVTLTDVIVYAYDGSKVITTEFYAHLSEEVRCVGIDGGRVFIGCGGGKVYEAVYKSLRIVGYRFLRFCGPDGFFASIRNIFKRPTEEIKDLSVLGRRLVAIGSKGIRIFSTENGLKRLKDVPCNGDYVGVQIMEDSPLMFYCISKSGARDYYVEDVHFMRKEPYLESPSGVETAVSFLSTPRCFTSVITKSTSSRISYVTFNDFHLRNFSRLRPVENAECTIIYAPVKAIEISKNVLIALCDNKVSIYNLLNSRSLFMSSRLQNLQELYSAYGDIEFMAKYYELCSLNEDASHMTALCRNLNVRSYAVFVFLYKFLEPILYIDLGSASLMEDDVLPGFVSDEEGNGSGKVNELLDEITVRAKTLKRYIPSELTEANAFIEDLIQTCYYVSLLQKYRISFSATLESILTKDTPFRVDTLKALLTAVSATQSIDPLLKAMKSKCPAYLPYEEINMRRGIEILRREEGNYLQQSLECFLNAFFDKSIIKRYNELKYFYGSTMLIKEKADVNNYDEIVSLCKESVRCKKAVDIALADTRETFLYPLFEALSGFQRLDTSVCCSRDQDLEFSLYNYMADGSHPTSHKAQEVFESFLRDITSRAVDPNNPSRYNMYWKYLLARSNRLEHHLAIVKKQEAVEAMVSLSDRPEIPFSERILLLEQALTVAVCCGTAAAQLRYDIKLKLTLAHIQEDLMARDPSSFTSRLLSPNELLNDYCYRYPDLSMRIIDIADSKDTAWMRKHMEAYLSEAPLSEALLFVGRLSRKWLPVFLEVFTDKDFNINELSMHAFEEAGISKSEVICALNTLRAQSSTHGLLGRLYEHLSGQNEPCVYMPLNK